ncbi:MAG: hypothetical protein Q8S13_07320, partial [Dehalococcoidia bacterium]|nr:hypothetical protein [Dehalococcoidia bacterium]
MSVRRVWITKRKTGKRYEYWQARVMVNGRRASALRDTWAAARQAEDDLTSALRASGLEEARESVRIATVQDLLIAYGEDLEARGKSKAVVMLPAYLIASMRTSSPKLLAVPVGQVADAHLFAYRKAREAQRRAPATINRDFRTLRAALKRARPAYR